MGKHSLKAGFEFRMLRNNYYQSNNPGGLFYLDARMTSANPTVGTAGSNNNSGNGFASFLPGMAITATRPSRENGRPESL